MDVQVYLINAFADNKYLGNPACVVPLQNWLSFKQMLNIAKNNNVAETAFFIKKENYFDLRWFTPDIEMDLCGHATLATAHCIVKHFNYSDKIIKFKSLSGDLNVSAVDGVYHLDLPKRVPIKSELPEYIYQSLSIKPKSVLKSRDYVLIYDSQDQIEQLSINRILFDKINLDTGGVVVTAKGNECDFVSRFFTPQATFLEDAVTGSSHCSLIPYWASILKKDKMIALQVSERGGKLFCINNLERISVGGSAMTVSKKKMSL